MLTLSIFVSIHVIYYWYSSEHFCKVKSLFWYTYSLYYYWGMSGWVRQTVEGVLEEALDWEFYSGLALGSATCWPSESERKEAFPRAFYAWGFPGGSDSKEYACNSGDLGSVTGLRRGPGEGNGNPLQYFCLEYSMYRGAWQVIVHGVTNSRRRLSNEHFFHFLCMRHFHTLLYYFTNFSYSHTIFIIVSIFKCHV